MSKTLIVLLIIFKQNQISYILKLICQIRLLMISPTHVHSTQTHSGFKCHRYFSFHKVDTRNIFYHLIVVTCSDLSWMYGLIQWRNVKSCKTFKCLQFFFHQLLLLGTHALHLRFYSSKVVIQFRFQFCILPYILVRSFFSLHLVNKM